MCWYENSGRKQWYYSVTIAFWVLQLHYCHWIVFTGAVSYSHARFGQGDGAILSNTFECFGNESDLFNCSRHRIPEFDSYCQHSNDVGVECPSGE